jgi:hypothetical protein
MQIVRRSPNKCELLHIASDFIYWRRVGCARSVVPGEPFLYVIITVYKSRQPITVNGAIVASWRRWSARLIARRYNRDNWFSNCSAIIPNEHAVTRSRPNAPVAL